MATIQTRYFGEVPEEVGLSIEFSSGLPAFEGERRFLAIEHPKTGPLILLQSMATRDLCFLALPVSTVDPAYRLQMSAEDMSAIGIDESALSADQKLAVLALVVVGPNARVTANLMAPIVVSRENHRAVQAVRCDGVYAHDHPVFLPAGTLAGEEKSCS